MKIIGSDESNRDQMIDDSDNNQSTEMNENDKMRIHLLGKILKTLCFIWGAGLPVSFIHIWSIIDEKKI